MFATIYGERNEINSFIKLLENRGTTVLIGKEFWHRISGSKTFYYDLISASEEVAEEVNLKKLVDETLREVSKKIEKRYKDLFQSK